MVNLDERYYGGTVDGLIVYEFIKPSRIVVIRAPSLELAKHNFQEAFGYWPEDKDILDARSHTSETESAESSHD